MGPGFESPPGHHVGASCISLAPTFFQKVRAHSFRCSSFPTAIRFAGFAVGLGCRSESLYLESVHAFHVGASCISLAPTFFKSRSALFRCASSPDHNPFVGMQFGFGAEQSPFFEHFCRKTDFSFSRSPVITRDSDFIFRNEVVTKLALAV